MIQPERLAKMRAVLARRQPDLTVLMDNVHKPHNFAAVVRTCDAVGVMDAHAWWNTARIRVPHLASGGSRRWVRVHHHPDVEAAFARLRAEGFRIMAADSCAEAIDYREADYTQPTAIVLGSELDGLHPVTREQADGFVAIATEGWVESLNVSVAGALILFEAMAQRRRAGLYDTCRLSPEVFDQVLFEWAYPKLAALCRKRQVAYPPLDEVGNVLGDLPR